MAAAAARRHLKNSLLCYAKDNNRRYDTKDRLPTGIGRGGSNSDERRLHLFPRSEIGLAGIPRNKLSRRRTNESEVPPVALCLAKETTKVKMDVAKSAKARKHGSAPMVRGSKDK